MVLGGPTGKLILVRGDKNVGPSWYSRCKVDLHTSFMTGTVFSRTGMWLRRTVELLQKCRCSLAVLCVLSEVLIDFHSVTYSGLSIHDGTLLHSKKSIHYSQTQSATPGTHAHVRPARSRNTNSYRTPPTGPPAAILQHSLPFLQS
jgi:hypothetical protein